MEIDFKGLCLENYILIQIKSQEMKKSGPTGLKSSRNGKQPLQNKTKLSIKESKKPTQWIPSKSQQHTSPKKYSQYQMHQFRTDNNLNQCFQSHECSYNNQDVSGFVRSRFNQSQVRENVLTLRERLRNIQDHYQKLIEEQKAKDHQKSEIVLGLIDEMQIIHQQKLISIRKMIEESAQQKRDVGEVDQKINDIKGNIQQLIQQSNNLKVKNDELQVKIHTKLKLNHEKEQELQQISKELLQSRNEVEQFEIVNLKNNKFNREIAELFKSASTIASD